VINEQESIPEKNVSAVCDYCRQYSVRRCVLRLRGRLALKYIDRDGYLDNTVTGEEDVTREDLVGRATLAWDATENLELQFQYQYGKLEHEGGNNQYSFCDTTTDQSPAPGYQNTTGAIAAAFGDDCKANYKRSGSATKNGVNVEGKETNVDTYALTVNWEVGDHLITSLTGYATYDYVDLQDGDRSPAEATLPQFAEDYEQWTQEFRLTSPLGERFDYIAGLYFMEKEQLTDYTVHFNVPVPVLAASRNTYTKEEGTTYAVFGQFTSHFNEQWDLTVGGRYTYEEKQASSQQLPTELYSNTLQAVCINPIPGVCATHNIEDEYVKVDARLTLSGADSGWQVSLIGRNLDNDVSTSYGDDVPAQAGTVWRSVDAPRSLALQANLHF